MGSKKTTNKFEKTLLMKNRYTKKLIIILMMLLAPWIINAVPSWTVQETKYSNTMTITGIVNISGTELSNSNDMVAAFVGTECRGVAHLLPSSILGHAYAYVMAMSNTNGEKLQFKVYRSSDGSIINIPDSCVFTSDESLGTQEEPYLFSDKTVSGNSLFSFSLGVKGENIVIDSADNSINVKLPAGTDITVLTPIINTSAGAIVVISGNNITSKTEVDFTQPVTVSIVSQNGKNSRNWTIVVQVTALSVNNKSLENYAIKILSNGVLQFSNFPETAKYSLYLIPGQCIVSSAGINDKISLSNFGHALYVLVVRNSNEILLFSKKIEW